MAQNAQKCVAAFSPSGWVKTWVQMCDGSLAVLFKGGKCCWYPNAPAAYFELAQAWHDAGEFVRTFLWKKLPYKEIALPCPAMGCTVVPACSSGHAIPTTLHGTWSGAFADNIVLHYNSSTSKWDAAYTACSLDWIVHVLCIAGNWWVQGATTGGIDNFGVAASSVNYSPLSIDFTGVSISPCGGTCPLTVTP